MAKRRKEEGKEVGRPEEAVGVVWVVRPNSLPKPPAARYRAQPRICGGRAVLLFRNQRAAEGNDGKEGAEAALSNWTPEETQAGGI